MSKLNQGVYRLLALNNVALRAIESAYKFENKTSTILYFRRKGEREQGPAGQPLYPAQPSQRRPPDVRASQAEPSSEQQRGLLLHAVQPREEDWRLHHAKHVSGRSTGYCKTGTEAGIYKRKQVSKKKKRKKHALDQESDHENVQERKIYQSILLLTPYYSICHLLIRPN